MTPNYSREQNAVGCINEVFLALRRIRGHLKWCEPEHAARFLVHNIFSLDPADEVGLALATREVPIRTVSARRHSLRRSKDGCDSRRG